MLVSGSTEDTFLAALRAAARAAAAAFTAPALTPAAASASGDDASSPSPSAAGTRLDTLGWTGRFQGSRAGEAPTAPGAVTGTAPAAARPGNPFPDAAFVDTVSNGFADGGGGTGGTAARPEADGLAAAGRGADVDGVVAAGELSPAA